MDCIAREKGFVAEDDLFGSLDGGRSTGKTSSTTPGRASKAG